MEVSGAVLRRSPISSATGLRRCSGDPSVSCQRRSVLSMRPRGFSDEEHLKYYIPPVIRCGAKEQEKKRARLVKGLSKNLSAFYSMSFGVEIREGVVMADVKGKMMKEAAELLLSQLKQLRAEEKELKRKKKKKQKKKEMKMARMKDCADDSSSGSSSSESSDSESETAVKLSARRVADTLEQMPAIRVAPTEASVCSQALLPLEIETEAKVEEKPNASTHGCGRSGVVTAKAMDKIEVCMGGKCKKSGATELLAELQKGVGMEGAVVGCKCMGRCKDGPNVRVVKHSNAGEDAVKPSRGPLCIGVGLEDVSSIVSNFFGDYNDAGLLPA